MSEATPFQDTSLVKEAFAGVVGGLSSVVAQRVHLTLECRARLKEPFRPFKWRLSLNTSCART